MQKAQHSLDEVAGNSSKHVLPTARLGREGPQVTRLGYGLMGLVSYYYGVLNT